MNIIISFIIAVVAGAIPWVSLAKEIDIKRADQLIKKYNSTAERPNSCPLESKKLSDLIPKTNALKDLLKGKCQKKDGETINEILNTIKSIQDDLRSNSIVSNTASVENALNTIIPQASSGTVSGLQFGALFANVSTLFKKNECSTEDGSLLGSLADVIYDSTQLGLIAGNTTGLTVAGIGFLVASGLRLINLIFKQRFNFEKPIDRQTFVKLNCSFYEIRRELDLRGTLEIESTSSREDYHEIKEISEDLADELKTIDREKANIDKTYAEIDRKAFAENVGDLTSLKDIFSKINGYLKGGVNGALETPSETQKLLMISKLAQDYNVIAGQMLFYKKLKISSIPMLDDLFINELKRFDSLDISNFTDSLNISAKDFNENYRAKILFHIIRIGNDISEKENTLANQTQKIKNDLSSALEKKRIELAEKLVEVKKVETKLGNVVAPKEYSGLDDGSESLLSIIDDHKVLSKALYGEWGDKFLKFLTNKADDESKSFESRYNSFDEKYEELVRNSDEKRGISTSHLCQDAQQLRLIFKHADALTQEGFDFVATNKDLIFSKSSGFLREGFSKDEASVTGPLSATSRVQYHYKSAVFALKELKGEEISTEDRARYLEKSWMGSFYLGNTMLKVSGIKEKAQRLQDLYEKFNCQKKLAGDFDN